MRLSQTSLLFVEAQTTAHASNMKTSSVLLSVLASSYFCVCMCLLLAAAPFSVVASPTSLALSKVEEPVVSEEALEEIEEIIEGEIAKNLISAHLGVSPEYAAASCRQIGELRPGYASGYYWVRGGSGPTGVYCELQSKDVQFEREGGWMRVAHVDMREDRSECPDGLELNKVEDKQLCQRPRDRAPGCASALFPVQGIRYSTVCGKVIGYHYYYPNGFGPSRGNAATSIDTTYVDGVSITHGTPRKHIWSFAAAPAEELVHGYNACPCLFYDHSFEGTIPSFVANDYYCDTGSRNVPETRYYLQDPLWDGQGCENKNHCCERGGPWFCRELPASTSDDIELRICGNDREVDNTYSDDVLVENIELYIQ